MMSYKIRMGTAMLVATLVMMLSPMMTGTAHAATPFSQCPAVGADTECGLLITINPDGSATVTASGQGAFDGVEDTLIGVQNNAPIALTSIPINGSGIFALDGDGLCTFITCSWPNPTTYEGPGTSFTITDANGGFVNFTTPLAPGGSAYFSVEGAVNAGGITIPTTTVTYNGATSSDFNDPATLSATLLDHNGAALVGKTITFVLNGAETCTGTTDATGLASCSVTPGEAAGSYTVTASFAGDGTNLGSSTTSPFTVTQEQASLASTTSLQTFSQGQSASLSAVLTDPVGGAPISSKSVSITLGSQSCTGTTDGTGTATCSISPVTVGLGSQAIVDSFAGDTFYVSATNNQSGFVNTTTKTTYNGATTSDFNDPATLSATLTDNAGTGIAGEPIVFTLNGAETCTGTTDATGLASCSVTPGETPGSYTVTASFAGDATHLASNTSSPFTVTLEESALASTTSLQVIATGGPTTLSATLTDPVGGAPIPGKPVTIALGSQSCTGTTNASGVASCTISSVSGTLGPTTVTDTFAGDTFYKPASNTQHALLFAFLAQGAFAVGDKTAAAATSSTVVTWWGAQWWLLNSLSGGAAPAAFKGFALHTSEPPACGTTWTTAPGDSPPPPGSVPSYMGVIVTSKVSQSGNVISGNIVHIVVVQTLPGYQGDPGHPGTGTIVATYC